MGVVRPKLEIAGAGPALPSTASPRARERRWIRSACWWVPHCWSLAGLDWITRSYQPKPLISAFFRGLVDTVWLALYEENLHYVQPGAGVFDSAGLVQEYWWFREAGHQHAGQTYLKMYGAPQVIFPVPPASPVPARAGRPRPPIEAR